MKISYRIESFKVLEEYYLSSCIYTALKEIKVEDSENREKEDYLIKEYEKKYKRIKILGIVLSLLILGAVAGYYLINSSIQTTKHTTTPATSPSTKHSSITITTITTLPTTEHTTTSPIISSITQPQTAKIIDITKTYIPITQPNTTPTFSPTQTKPTSSTTITTTLPSTTLHTTTLPTTTHPPTTTSPTSKIPEIESLEYKERVKKGELQEIKLIVNDVNHYKAILKLNNTIIDVPFYKKIDSRALFYVSFDPRIYFEREGRVYGNVTVYDEEGRSSSKDLSFLVNLEEPKIDVNIKKIDFGKYELCANVSDENLEDVKLFLNGKEWNLLEKNGLYIAFIEVYEDSNFTLVARDKFGLESKFSGNIFVSRDNPNAYYALKRGLDKKYIYLILPLDNDSIQDSNKKAFIDYLVDIQKYLEDERLKNEILKFTSDGKITSDEISFLRIISKNSDENVKSILNIYFDSPKTFNEILRNANNDANVKIDRDVFVGEVCKIAEKLGIGDYVKVLNVKNNSFEIKEINLPTIQAIGNYTLAIKQLNLPIHEKENIWLLTNATMINTDIFDFKPVIVKDMYGNSYVILSKNVARDTWALVEFLKHFPEIVKYPETYFGIGIGIQQLMYDLVDNPTLHEMGGYFNPNNEII